jgi:hypothetical protein
MENNALRWHPLIVIFSAYNLQPVMSTAIKKVNKIHLTI